MKLRRLLGREVIFFFLGPDDDRNDGFKTCPIQDIVGQKLLYKYVQLLNSSAVYFSVRPLTAGDFNHTHSERSGGEPS